MSLRSRLVVSTAGLALLAACSSDSMVQTGVTADKSATGEAASAGAGARRVHELNNVPSEARANPHGGGGNTGIFYHGGPVLQAATKVVAIYWANSTIYTGGPGVGTTGTGSQDNSLIGYFLRNLGGSSYFNINTTYTDGSGTPIANVVTYNGFWANGTGAPTGSQNVSDADILAMLGSGFDSGKITYDPNTLYVVFTSGTVNLGGGFGTQYCAYHWNGVASTPSGNKTVLYSAMPYDAAYPGACTNGTAAPNGDVGADAEVNTLAHEIEETTTDPLGTAWYDRRGYENADKCAWNFGSTSTAGGGVWNITVGTKHFLVQQNWANAGSGGCFKSWP
jgi:hypothetical protein